MMTRLVNRGASVGRGLRAVLLLTLAAAQPVRGQQAVSADAAALASQPSGRAQTRVELRRRTGDRSRLFVTIDYGQPHARGRTIVGGVVPFDVPWRTGANEATSLTTDVDLVIGGAVVPKGSYTLYTLPSRGGWKLIINKNTGQWGTEYRQEHDLARVDLQTSELREPLESFTIWLVPDVTRNEQGGVSGGLPRGVLRLAWGTVELSTDWRVR